MRLADRPYRMRVDFPRSRPVEVYCTSVDQCLQVVSQVKDMRRARDGTQMLMKKRTGKGRYTPRFLWYKSAGTWTREELAN